VGGEGRDQSVFIADPVRGDLPVESITMTPFDTEFLARERIDDLMRTSADIRRRPDRPPIATRLATAFAAGGRRRAAWRPTAASVLATLRLTERT
jgi:hypothetical protein